MAKEKTNEPEKEQEKPQATAPPKPEKEQEKPQATAPPKPKASVCKPTDRAPTDGSLTRFKIRADNYGPRTSRYILAPDEASARALYIEVEGIAVHIASLKANGSEKIEPPALVVTRLRD